MYLAGLRIFPNVLTDQRFELLLPTQSAQLGYYVPHDHRLALFPVHQKPDESRLLAGEGVVHSLFVKILETLEKAR